MILIIYWGMNCLSNIKTGWSVEQLELLDNYLKGYTEIKNQDELSKLLGKSLNSVKIRISRRKVELGGIKDEEMRKLTIEEYLIFLSNRFDKTTEKIASIIGVTESYLEEELDEIDCLETVEHMLEDFQDREMTYDETKVFSKLIKKGKGSFQIAHILNRPIDFIEGLMIG
jgi:hypothetical protein